MTIQKHYKWAFLVPSIIVRLKRIKTSELSKSIVLAIETADILA